MKDREENVRDVKTLWFTFVFFLSAITAFPAGLDTLVFYANQILSKPTDSTVTISVIPKKAVQVYFEYGTTQGSYPLQTTIKSTAAGVPLRFTLQGLSPDTRYYYRIQYKVNGNNQFILGESCQFTTCRAKGQRYKFSIIADSHLYDKKGVPSMMRATLQNMLQDKSDFVIDLGDTFGDDHYPATITAQEMMDLHRLYLPYIGTVCNSSHFYFCIGNHEGENGYYLLQTPPNNISVYASLARKYYYANPVPNNFYSGNSEIEPHGIGQPENYFAWTWGDALFVILDVYRYAASSAKPENWAWTIGDAQYQWFKQTLESSNAKYKFVFAHHVRGEGRGAVTLAKNYEWGGYERNGNTYSFPVNRPGWAFPIHQLMVQNNVQIFFQGHDHLFAQEMLDGIAYQETPMPSDSTYTIGMLANADAYTANQLSGSGYLLVSVGPDSAKVEFIRGYLPADTTAATPPREVAFSYSVLPVVSSVHTDSPAITNFSLQQNYPNPCNPSSTIQYTLSEPGIVTLSVSNLLGETVTIMENSFQKSGEHKSVFNGTNLPSGVYFYTLRCNGNTLTKKLLLMR